MKLYIPFKRYQTIYFVREKNSYKKFTKNQSKKLLQCNLVWIIILKFKNVKIFNVFIIIFYVNVKKYDIQSTEKQNMTSDYVSVCFNCVAL